MWPRLLAVVALVLVVYAFLVQPYQVVSSSMVPTLAEGERVLVLKLDREPSPGDIVVLAHPHDQPPAHGVAALLDPVTSRIFGRNYPLLIKRVVGVAGDVVEARGGRLYRNGVVADDWGPTFDFGPVTVPPGTVYVMGDNRRFSSDSRDFGPVPADHVVGRAWLVIWPVRTLG